MEGLQMVCKLFGLPQTRRIADLLDRVDHRDPVIVRRYPNARHGFDIEDSPGLVDTGRGTTVGGNREAAVAAWSEILRFLREH